VAASCDRFPLSARPTVVLGRKSKAGRCRTKLRTWCAFHPVSASAPECGNNLPLGALLCRPMTLALQSSYVGVRMPRKTVHLYLLLGPCHRCTSSSICAYVKSKVSLDRAHRPYLLLPLLLLLPQVGWKYFLGARQVSMQDPERVLVLDQEADATLRIMAEWCPV